jgi:hypothetical protein
LKLRLASRTALNDGVPISTYLIKYNELTFSVLSSQVYVTTDREWGNRETSGQWKVYTVAPHTCQDLGGTELYVSPTPRNLSFVLSLLFSKLVGIHGTWLIRFYSDKQISSFGPNPDIKCTVYQ